MTGLISFMNLNIILSLALFFASIIIPFCQIIFIDKYFRFQNIPEILLKYALFFNVGCLFITGCAGQFLYAPEISAGVGWGWSPFQYELAFSELGLGILGLISPLFTKDFWLATIIAAAVWLVGGSAVHLYSLYFEGNMAITTANFVIIWNILIAAWLIACYLAYAKSWTRFYKLMTEWSRSRKGNS
ncbi:hypothetical protein H0X06_03885 [Candidatus Dependentiae bacterium]|nr:hypothetical protein [Candidatus Dependentiae bacterium]